MNCFAHAVDNVYMGQVQYVDYNNITFSSENISPSDYMLKQLAFQYEKEVIACVCHPDIRQDTYNKYFDKSGLMRPLDSVNLDDILLYPQRSGIFIDGDVNTLIENIVISPLSPTGFLILSFR